MSYQDDYALAKFGFDAVYVHKGFAHDLLEKLHQRAVLSLDAEDNIVQKYATHDMILVFKKRELAPSLIYRFLKFLDQDANKEDFIKSNTLLNEDELYTSVFQKLVFIFAGILGFKSGYITPATRQAFLRQRCSLI